MALKVLPAVVMVAVVVSEQVVMKYDTNDHHHFQYGQPGKAVTGVYGWTSPEGHHFLVRYIADAAGFRVIESNAVPVNADGLRADGQQGALQDTQAHS